MEKWEGRGQGHGGKRILRVLETQVTIGIIFKLLLVSGLCLTKCSAFLVLTLGPLGSQEMRVTHVHTAHIQFTSALPRLRPQGTVSAPLESTVPEADADQRQVHAAEKTPRREWTLPGQEGWGRQERA